MKKKDTYISYLGILVLSFTSLLACNHGVEPYNPNISPTSYILSTPNPDDRHQGRFNIGDSKNIDKISKDIDEVSKSIGNKDKKNYFVVAVGNISSPLHRILSWLFNKKQNTEGTTQTPDPIMTTIDRDYDTSSENWDLGTTKAASTYSTTYPYPPTWVTWKSTGRDYDTIDPHEEASTTYPTTIDPHEEASTAPDPSSFRTWATWKSTGRDSTNSIQTSPTTDEPTIEPF